MAKKAFPSPFCLHSSLLENPFVLFGRDWRGECLSSGYSYSWPPTSSQKCPGLEAAFIWPPFFFFTFTLTFCSSQKNHHTQFTCSLTFKLFPLPGMLFSDYCQITNFLSFKILLRTHPQYGTFSDNPAFHPIQKALSNHVSNCITLIGTVYKLLLVSFPL